MQKSQNKTKQTKAKTNN